jgi:ankyrin repeat protein
MRYISLIMLVIAFLIQVPDALADSYEELLAAIKLNDVPAAEALFAKGMDVNTTDPNANTLLMLAVRDNHIEMVKRLLERHAKVAARNRYGETALTLAAARGDLGVVSLLVEQGAGVNHPGWNPLIYAAWKGKTEVVKYLLEKGAEIDAVSPNGISALMMAARSGHFETVKLLLWETADPNIKSDSGGTALAWALKGGNTDIVGLLKQAGARE